MHAAEVIDRISREYDFLHGLTCTLATNLKGNKPTEKAFLDSLKELISAEASNQKLRDTFANLSLDPDSPLTLQIVSGKINEQWHDFNEAIEEINRLAEQPDAIFTCGFNVASLLKKADRLYRYKAFTVDAYFEKKNEPMNRFFTNAFIVFKALEKGKVSDGLTEEEYRKNPSVLYYEQTSKGLEAAIGTLSLLLEQVGIKLDAQGAIRKTAQSLCNFQAGIDFVQEIKKAVELLKSCTDEQFQAIADKSLNEITQVCKLTEENQAVVRALFEGIKNVRQEKKSASDKTRASAHASKSPDSDKGFWKDWGNWLVVGIGALAFIGAFLTGSEDSKLGKIIAGLGLGAVIGGLVAKFHKSLSWIFGVEEGVKQAKPQVDQPVPGL